jgi:hypothetical protein
MALEVSPLVIKLVFEIAILLYQEEILMYFNLELETKEPKCVLS